jgi:hypothetical protein
LEVVLIRISLGLLVPVAEELLIPATTALFHEKVVPGIELVWV